MNTKPKPWSGAGMKRCHRCGTEWISEKKQPAVKEYCPKCSAYLHACLNCRFHDPKVHNQCHIPTTDWVGDRAGANFCDEFEFRDTEETVLRQGEKKQARQALDQLLGGAAAPESKKPSSLVDLFVA